MSDMNDPKYDTAIAGAAAQIVAESKSVAKLAKARIAMVFITQILTYAIVSLLLIYGCVFLGMRIFDAVGRH